MKFGVNDFRDGVFTGSCIGLGIGIIGAAIYGIFKFWDGYYYKR